MTTKRKQLILKKKRRNNTVRVDKIACTHIRKMWSVVTKIL